MDFENLPLYGEYDVVVAGGGTSGFAAGVAAARAGARTLIVEDHGYLGGTSTGGMTSQFLGFAGDETLEGQRGVFGELLRRLVAIGASNGIGTIYLTGRTDMDVKAASYNSDDLKLVMDRMAREADVHVLLHTRIVSLAKDGDRIDRLVIHNAGGLQAVRARIFVDATFHGSVAAEAGCPWTIGDEKGQMQPGALMYRASGVNIERYASLSLDEKNILAARGVAEGRLPFGRIVARVLSDGTIYCGMSRVPVDPLDADSISRAEARGREQVREIAAFFREVMPGFERSYIAATGGFLGLRDSRRILGRYVLTTEDVMNGTHFPDAVVSSSYPIDFHRTDDAPSVLIRPAGGEYHIPYRCMVGDVPNLVVTGRCISADSGAHACIRVMVICMRLGEIAGIAAAEAAKRGGNVSELDGTSLAEQAASISQ